VKFHNVCFDRTVTFIKFTIAAYSDVLKSAASVMFLLTVVFFTWQPYEVKRVFHKSDVLITLNP
jgi:hypothetical protein